VKKRSVKKTKKIVEKYMFWWTRWLGLRWHNFSICYDNNWKEFDKKTDQRSGMRIYPDWRYMMFEIWVNLPPLRELSEETIEHMVVHECMHVFLNELRIEGSEQHNNHEERVATMLENAFLYVRDQVKEECAG